MKEKSSRRAWLRRLAGGGLLLAAAATMAGCREVVGPAKAVAEVQFWHAWNRPSVVKALDGVVAAFNAQYPALKVVTEWGVASTRSLLATAGGQPPDLTVLFPGGSLAAWSANGALRALNDFVAATHYDLAAFIPSTIDEGRLEGQLYALPLGIGAYMLYYNRTILSEVGVSAPPRTLEETQAISDKLVQKRGTTYRRVGFIPLAGYGADGDGFSLYAYLFGGQLWDPRAQEFTVSSPANVEALRWLVDYYRRYGVTALDEFQAGFGRSAGADGAFFSGKVPMMIDGQWQVFNAQDAKLKIDFDVAPIPYPANHPQQANLTLTRTHSYVIPAQAPQAEGAWQFMSWSQTGDGPVILAEAVTDLPAVKSYLTNAKLEKIDPRYTRFLRYLTGPNVFPQLPATPVTSELADSLSSAMDLAIHGGAAPEAALSHVQSVVDQELTAAKRRAAQN
jgi:multiple sugar transport system substrate-binding protein